MAEAANDDSAPPLALVDVEAQMEKRAAASSQKLNWRLSIADLLKLINLDSSLKARKELATELNCPPELMQDSAPMNVRLHTMVLAKIAVNGGRCRSRCSIEATSRAGRRAEPNGWPVSKGAASYTPADSSLLECTNF